jgi:hypothetical protein
MIWVVWVLCFWFILSLFLIPGIADNLPVFSWVLTLNLLIINTIHFSGVHAFSCAFCLEHDKWDFSIFHMLVAWWIGLVVIFGLLLISGLLPVFSCVLAVTIPIYTQG